MSEEGFFAPLRMGMRSSVSASGEMLSALLETPALHALLDSFSEALIVCDGDSRVRFINLAAERVNRVTRVDVLGLPDVDFFQRSALQFDDFQQALRRGGKSALTRSRDGRVFLTRAQAVPTGAYEKPYNLLIQREYEPGTAGSLRSPSGRASTTDLQGLGDPQDNALHMSPLLSSIADMGVR
ncbi:PAS domain-containing protein, partial [Pseudomonas nitroreducens]